MIDLLASHRSVRRNTPESIPSAPLTDLIRAGQGAASSSFIQAYSAIRVTRPDVRSGIARAAGIDPA